MKIGVWKQNPCHPDNIVRGQFIYGVKACRKISSSSATILTAAYLLCDGPSDITSTVSSNCAELVELDGADEGVEFWCVFLEHKRINKRVLSLNKINRIQGRTTRDFPTLQFCRQKNHLNPITTTTTYSIDFHLIAPLHIP